MPHFHVEIGEGEKHFDVMLYRADIFQGEMNKI
jgi:hypothetical protein